VNFHSIAAKGMVRQASHCPQARQYLFSLTQYSAVGSFGTVPSEEGRWPRPRDRYKPNQPAE